MGGLAKVLGLAVLSLISSTIAETGIPASAFQNDPGDAAAQAAPLWLLPAGTCFPSAASWNGQQTNGNDADHCNIVKLDHNCPEQPPKNGQYTQAHDFPTYYVVRNCPDLNQWRIAYDVYFTKDTGHKSDWEWAVVIFTQGSDSNYYRDSVVLQNEGGPNGYVKWTAIPEAYATGNDIHNNDGSNGDHAKLYFGKWHHSVHTDPYGYFRDTCPPNGPRIFGADDYRKDDYYYIASNWLEDGSTIPGSWDWGAASSFPASFLDGGSNDICWKI